MANVEHIPPPDVMRHQGNVMNSQRKLSPADGSGLPQTEDAMASDGWAQPIDYWYNRVISKSSPAANTANPSALGLIAFGYTTALLQVRSTWHAGLSKHAQRLCAEVCINLTSCDSQSTDILLQGANTKWTEMSTEYVTLGFALFFGGLVQLLAGMWEFRRNNMFAATALSSYGGFWLSYGQLPLKQMLQNASTETSALDAPSPAKSASAVKQLYSVHALHIMCD